VSVVCSISDPGAREAFLAALSIVVIVRKEDYRKLERVASTYYSSFNVMPLTKLETVLVR
jgi:hypothetical protein